MKRLKNFLDNFEGYVCVVMLIAMSIIVFMQVICRFILKSSLPWSEEASRYLLVWVSFLGGAYGVRKGAHLGVEAVLLLLPKKLRGIVELLSMVLGVVLCSVILKYGVDIVITQMNRMQYSPAMRIPMGYIYLAIPVGMVLFIVRYIQNIIDKARCCFAHKLRKPFTQSAKKKRRLRGPFKTS